MGNLKPNQPLIYEQENGLVYARYRDIPSVPRWIVGGDPSAVAESQGELLDYSEWKNLCELCNEYPTLKGLMKELVTTYYMVKDKNE